MDIVKRLGPSLVVNVHRSLVQLKKLYVNPCTIVKSLLHVDLDNSR